MEIRYGDVRDCAKKVRAVGEDVAEFLNRAKSTLDKAAEGNEGFTAVKAFGDVNDKLHRQSTAVGEATAKAAGALNAAVDDHERTDRSAKNNLDAVVDALG
ncbi:hypothetical protein [Phytomonospora endophytica]|uniref:Uncharacterized protein YukE n=1 Tax=Phytomonospora endophytica TaxID=714109 RepID=A0A841FH43_9ACTN|nr:hypothetical protein [Phytomonospora endophytica]MBB6032882.1 uncharacterized protein YukE [Phytomonospora endophytica]GIG65108.1 hypothetical protein Pen01_14030 [Phytomonospora endophytica]